MNIVFNFLILNSIFLIISSLQENKSNFTNPNKTININYTSYFINSTIKTLNYRNFDTIIKSKNDFSDNHLILFTFRRCPICNKLIRIVENVDKYYKSKNIKNLKFGKIDSYANTWLTMRFDLFKLPAYVYISNGKFSSFFPNNITEEELIDYIENKEKDYKLFPDEIGYFGVFMKIFNRLTEKIKQKIPFWNQACSWFVIFFLLGCFIFFEYSLYKKACCDNNNINKEENHKMNNKEHKKENKKKFKKE